MNNPTHIQEGTWPTSLPLLLLQVLNLTQISPELYKRAEQLELSDSIELARKHISEALQSKQPIWKRNEQLIQSNNRLLELISNEVQWYADEKQRNRELLEFVSKLRSNPITNMDSDVTNETELEKRLDISLNYTVDEHPINNFQPLSPDDVEVMLHTFLPYNSQNQQGIKHGNEDWRSMPHDDAYARRRQVNCLYENIQSPTLCQIQNSNTSGRQKRTAAASSLVNILINMYNDTRESETVKGETSSWGSFTSHVTILGLEKNPLRRNEQLQNLNLHLQNLVLEVIKNQRQELDENRQLQQKLIKLVIEKNENEEKQNQICKNQIRNLTNLQNKFENTENVTKEKHDLKYKLESLENNTTKHQEQHNLTYPDKDKQLLEASKSGNLSAALFLISIHANVSTHDRDTLTPLHWAAKDSHLELARALLEAGANPEAKDNDGNTPLHLAAESAISEILQLLTNSSNTLEFKNIAGETPLHVAIRSGNTEAAIELIKLGSNLTVRNNEDRSPLQLAALTGKDEVAQMLVDSGSEVDTRSENGYSALHLAALHGHVGVCRILLNSGADINALTLEKQTPLHFAVLSGYFPTVELLVQRGSKVKVRNSKGRTPTGIASRKGYKQILNLLGKH